MKNEAHENASQAVEDVEKYARMSVLDAINRAVEGKSQYQLTEDILKELLSRALDGQNLRLNETETEEFMIYAMKRAEEYHNTHSMRYTIMRDATRAIFKLN